MGTNLALHKMGTDLALHKMGTDLNFILIYGT